MFLNPMQSTSDSLNVVYLLNYKTLQFLLLLWHILVYLQMLSLLLGSRSSRTHWGTHRRRTGFILEQTGSVRIPSFLDPFRILMLSKFLKSMLFSLEAIISSWFLITTCAPQKCVGQRICGWNCRPVGSFSGQTSHNSTTTHRQSV